LGIVVLIKIGPAAGLLSFNSTTYVSLFLFVSFFGTMFEKDISTDILCSVKLKKVFKKGKGHSYFFF